MMLTSEKVLEKDMGILEVWDLYNERMERLIGNKPYDFLKSVKIELIITITCYI